MKLFVNALGIVTPLGRGKKEVAANLFKGSRAGLVERHDLIPNRSVWVGAVSGSLPEVPDKWWRYECRNNRLALVVINEIQSEISAAIHRYGADRIGVIMGTSTSGIAEGEAALAERIATGQWPERFRYEQQEIGNLAEFVAVYLGLTGPAYTITTACSSSGKAFASAQRLIDVGLCDAVLTGGVDSLCRLTLNGFNSLEALSQKQCNPFSLYRDGINIGEGAAIMLVSREPAVVSLLGVGESSDAYHVSAPDPQGHGALRAMERALKAASLPVKAIDYINLHGTATPLNDAMESRAISALFGEHVPCSSTKSMTGHMLGAAGACESAFLWLTLNHNYSEGLLPPHVWDGAVDPELPQLNFVGPTFRKNCDGPSAMMSNSFAFGGNNVAVIFGANK